MESTRLDRIETKLDLLVTGVGKVNEKLAVQHTLLQERGERLKIVEGQLRPLTKALHMVYGVFKLVGVIALGAGIVEAATAVATYIKKG